MFLRRTAALAATAFAFAVAVAVAPAPASASFTFGDPCNYPDSVIKDSVTALMGGAKITCLINKERAKKGLAPLTHDSALYKTARGHSLDTVQSHLKPDYTDKAGVKCVSGTDYDPHPNYWWSCAHDGSNGSWPENRVWASGFCNGCRVRENMYWGTGLTPSGVVNGWMASSGHRDAILDALVTHVATGVEVGTWSSANGATVTTNFAKR